uniref:Uncharacterized protein n=1 Tax=Arundo donax TaxID=35708 RepID=A0A0A9DSX7_ARUDO
MKDMHFHMLSFVWILLVVTSQILL